jgi:2-methylcitrate dehydratase PrpD
VDQSVTVQLAQRLVDTPFEAFPGPTVHAVKRSVLDWLGCAAAGSTHEQIRALVEVLRAAGGEGRHRVIGSPVRLGTQDAALANAQMGHIHDFDDTHSGAVFIHLASPITAALLAIAGRQPVAGAAFVSAWVLAFETAVRLGYAAPGHHRRGWHPTGTLGTIAAAVGAARLLQLDARRMANAIGIAVSQSAGVQQNRGTSCKSFHSGKAAAGGVLAALLAQAGFDSAPDILEGAKGFCATYSDAVDPQALLRGFGSAWAVDGNGHKPYACGLVLHPVIDGVIALRDRAGGDVSRLDAIALRVHPYVLSITGDPAPANGLRSKFSVFHSAAVSFVDGAAGLAQYGTPRVLAPEVLAVRARVSVVADERIGKDQAEVTLTVGGVAHSTFVDHATGTRDNPMSDAAIERKFRDNATPVLGPTRADALCDATWRLESLDDVAVLLG